MGANHVMRSFRVIIHANDGRTVPYPEMIAANPRDAVMGALDSLGSTWVQRIGRVEVEERTRMPDA